MKKPTLKAWSDAWNKSDLKGLVELYAHDGLVLHPNMPVVTGRPAIRDFFNGAMGDVRVEFLPSEAHFDGVIGYEWGEFHDLELTSNHIVARGTYVVTWVHRDGSWFIKTHTWNDLTRR